jgi:aldehyde dehydrogenase (NAD+)
VTRIDGGRMFIGGRLRFAGNVEPVVEPATEQWLGAGASESDIDDAVAAARRALGAWRSAPATHRAKVLNSLAGISRGVHQ